MEIGTRVSDTIYKKFIKIHELVTCNVHDMVDYRIIKSVVEPMWYQNTFSVKLFIHGYR